MKIIEILKNIIPDKERVTINETVLSQHGSDLTYHRPCLPDVVVFPKNREEVSAILACANEHKIPVTPFGTGTSLEGHVIPVRGGISMDMSLMNEILEIRPQDFLARVQPGVTRNQLNQRLKSKGLFFPIDPGADASLGGMAATNASGTSTVRYGMMRNQVLGMEVVLADGSIIKTGGMTFKSSSGYDIKSLFVGSEGTLGVITELTLKLYAVPEKIIAARAVFSDVEAAGAAAVDMIRSGLSIGRLELVDKKTIKAVNMYKDTSFPENHTLFIEFSGNMNAVQSDVEIAKEIAADYGCLSFDFEKDEKSRAKLWEARHQAVMAVAAAAPKKSIMITDVCVPISKLPDAIRFARDVIDQHGIEAAIFGHVGDGNFHVVFAVDVQEQEEVLLAKKVVDEIVHFALSNEGTCTGEHGIGLGKMKYLRQEHGDAVNIMETIKRVLDPNLILNPGKVLNIK